MIAVEDVDGNIVSTLQSVTLLTGKKVLDLGSGTGRIPLLTRGLGLKIIGLDLNRAMLREQQAQKARIGSSWPLLQADMRTLPIQAECFDVVIAGWAIGHLVGWHPEDWCQQIRKVLDEMFRATTPGGALIILETMTTGSLAPAPPHSGLAAYYTWLEEEWGFERQIIQTDYQFSDVEEAAACTQFFFGDELAQAIRQNQWARLPEWTGVWSMKKNGAR